MPINLFFLNNHNIQKKINIMNNARLFIFIILNSISFTIQIFKQDYNSKNQCKNINILSFFNIYNLITIWISNIIIFPFFSL